ncbi:MAG: hypothetical protein V3T58_08195 [Candidatus Hydrothermarchaeales archaeon]
MGIGGVVDLPRSYPLNKKQTRDMAERIQRVSASTTSVAEMVENANRLPKSAVTQVCYSCEEIQKKQTVI